LVKKIKKMSSNPALTNMVLSKLEKAVLYSIGNIVSSTLTTLYTALRVVSRT